LLCETEFFFTRRFKDDAISRKNCLVSHVSSQFLPSPWLVSSPGTGTWLNANNCSKIDRPDSSMRIPFQSCTPSLFFDLVTQPHDISF
jgi:hypothetical protein